MRHSLKRKTIASILHQGNQLKTKTGVINIFNSVNFFLFLPAFLKQGKEFKTSAATKKIKCAANAVTNMMLRDANLNAKTDAIRSLTKCHFDADRVFNRLIGNDQHCEQLQSRDVAKLV
jgi:hypothetical protein